MSSSFNTSIQTALLALQSVASNTVVVTPSPLTVAGLIAATAYVRFGRRAAAALSAAVELRIDGSAADSGDRDWFPLAKLITNIASVGDQAPGSTAASGQKIILMASTTGFAVGDWVFIDNTTIGNSEWGRIVAVDTNVSITLEDNLTNSQTAAAAFVYAGAQVFAPIEIDLAGRSVRRLRGVANAAGSGQAVAVEIKLTTVNSIG